ncbi:MAG: TatD family hydrolase, partial [Planctomycetota bacterium]
CPHKQQYLALEKQMQLARQADLPVILHCRDAHNALLDYCETYSRQWGKLKGVIHCFSGGPEEAKRYLDYGFYLSFAGPLTYKKNNVLREALKVTPLDRILVETDCPYLAPQSKRGLRNEPAYVTFIAEQAASELKIPIKSFHQAVTENAMNLFRLPRN